MVGKKSLAILQADYFEKTGTYSTDGLFMTIQSHGNEHEGEELPEM